MCKNVCERKRERELFLNGENVWFEECVTSPLCSQLTDLPQIQFQAQVLIPDQIKKYLGEFWFKNVHQARLLWHVKALL